MPFKSEAQRGYLFANHPQVAKEFAAATPKGKKLPYKAKKQHSMAAGINKGLREGTSGKPR